MCGLVALFDQKMSKAGRDLFSSLLYHGVERGIHSTGVMGLSKNECIVYKKAVPSYDFLDMRGAISVIDKADLGLVGHNRHATMGARNSLNAHPFTHGEITLVHNGTLTNKASLPEHHHFDTDSEAIAWALSGGDDYKSVLESLQGAYALIWYNSEDNCVYMAKNQERTLHLFELSKYKNSPASYALCSEEDMGLWVIGRDKVYDIEDHAEVQDGILYKMNLSTHDISTEEFTIKKPDPVPARNYGGSSRQRVRMVVDCIKDPNKIECSTIDGKADVTLYRNAQQHLTDVKVDDILEGEVSSSSGNNLWFTFNSCRKVQSSKPALLPSSTNTCGLCGKNITPQDMADDNWDFWADNVLVHDTCYNDVLKAM